ncbi:DoxX family protein [Streptomyces sp. 9-7]|uniref:DoxX family protein n=1 Tax=Streptomyces siderophoricus TaxID=2802281 RepID=A0ABS1MZM9_9ACTN|nr:DoxX family protein [Streptomyces sp. 9-7]
MADLCLGERIEDVGPHCRHVTGCGGDHLVCAAAPTPPTVKLIGTLEVLAAIGLVLPATLGIAPALAPLAALGLALVMIGAVVVHARRGEAQMAAVNVVLLTLAAVVAWGRFGPYSF